MYKGSITESDIRDLAFRIYEDFPVIKLIRDFAVDNGYEVYVVGGFVRDYLLGTPRADIDFSVAGDGPEFAEKLSAAIGGSEITVFRRFRTAYIRYQDFDLEFVGARKESYSEYSRNPEVIEGSFEDDIARRDFTINAMAIALSGERRDTFTDLYNGLQDLKSGLIRTPLEPGVTFSDDPLRIMRAIRFASVLGFVIEDKTLEGIAANSERITIVTQERITEEFLKILGSPNPGAGLRLLYETGVMKHIFPEAAIMGGIEQRKDYHHKDVFYHTCEVVDNISQKTDDVWLRFAALVHDIAKPQTKKFIEGTGWTFHGHEELGAKMMKYIFRRMKLPLNRLEYVKTLVRLHLRPIALVSEEVTDSAIRRLIVEAGEALEDLMTLCRADITSKNRDKVTKFLKNYDRVMDKVREVKIKDELRAFQSPVRGDEIMQICGLKPGRTVGDIKSAIEEAILEGEIPNTYEAALLYLHSIKNKFIK